VTLAEQTDDRQFYGLALAHNYLLNIGNDAICKALDIRHRSTPRNFRFTLPVFDLSNKV
jgi:hypothetical protein